VKAVSEVSLAVGVGLLCALLSALGTNLAFLLKQKGAVAAPDVDMRQPLRSAANLFRSKWWSVGWGVALDESPEAPERVSTPA
jgi:hypothetical protein